MLFRPLMRWAALLAAAMLPAVGGCVASHRQAGADPPVPPLAMQGPDAGVAIDFGVHPAVTVPHDLRRNEICYIVINDAIILCSLDQSFLLFGPDDGVELVVDNPMARLAPAGRDDAAADALYLYDTIFVIAGALDRLPDGLSDYLGSAAPHRREAIKLAQRLVDHDNTLLCGAARGGTFSVSLQLTPAGREKLEEALQSIDNPAGTVMVSRRRRFPIIGPE